MNTRKFRALTGALLCAIFYSGVAAAAEVKKPPQTQTHKGGPEPALWRIKNGDSTVYLFGSVHVLPKKFKWRTPAIVSATAAADQFVFEAPLTDRSMRDSQFYFEQHSTLPAGKRLTKMLSPQGLKDLRALIADTSIDEESLDSLRPWAASMAFGGTDGGSQDLSFFAGADLQFMHQAVDTGKPLRYLETTEQALGAFASMPPDVEVKQFEMDMHTARTQSKLFDAMLAAWSVGDDKKFVETENKFPQTPEFKKSLLDTRNRAWLPQIEQMMKEKRTIFITVGAGHLYGPGSVVAMLCEHGWKVERVRTGPTAPPKACGSETVHLRQ